MQDQRNARILTTTFGLIVTLILLANSSVVFAAEPTTVFLIRHTEKDLTTKHDPELTEAGRMRAQQLADMLQYVPLVAVYSTDTKRTVQTAMPLATNAALEIQKYAVGDLQEIDWQQLYAGQAVAVIGHSNTIPKLVNALIKDQRFEDLDESDYDSVFIVTMGEQSTATRLLVPLANKPAQ